MYRDESPNPAAPLWSNQRSRIDLMKRRLSAGLQIVEAEHPRTDAEWRAGWLSGYIAADLLGVDVALATEYRRGYEEARGASAPPEPTPAVLCPCGFPWPCDLHADPNMLSAATPAALDVACHRCEGRGWVDNSHDQTDPHARPSCSCCAGTGKERHR